MARKTLVKTISIGLNTTEIGRKMELKDKYNKDQWGFIVKG